VITQSDRPLAFFSRKLSVQQQKYSVTKIELLAIVETLKESKGMLLGQRIKVYTDHKNLTHDALGLTSDRMYLWRLILEEYGPEIVYIKEIHNTVADAISRLECVSPDTPSDNATMHQNWMTFSKCWCENNEAHDNSTNKHNYSMNNVFANRSDEEEIYTLITKEIVEAQKLDRHFKATALKEKYKKTLTENTLVFFKNGKLEIPRSLQPRAVGTTTIYSTLETHASKRQLKLQCTGNICVPLYAHTSKTVNLAR
jgi:TusA-related sulfurtransferase